MLRAIYNSKIGKILLESDGTFITGIHFLNERVENISKIDNPAFAEIVTWLDLYFKGENPNFTPAYKINRPTPFRKRVLDIVKNIPYGTTMTYKEIANKVADDLGILQMSAQAVGGAVGWNPIGILIPCHRVIGSDGALTGYAGGIKNKVALLELEGFQVNNLMVLNK